MTDLVPSDVASELALEALIAANERWLAELRVQDPTPIEHYALQHLAKATGTARSALGLIRAQRWTDASILTRAVFEQLFAYLWVVQDPTRAPARATMVTIKQEWANAKYLEGLARHADPADQARLLAEGARYKAIAEALLAQLACELGLTEKQVRDEATRKVSQKANEVALGPDFSVPFAYYSGFVHSDGNALAAHGEATPDGVRYDPAGAPHTTYPVARDLCRALARLSREVASRCGRWLGTTLTEAIATVDALLGE